MENIPKVSVIVPCYNSENFVKETILNLMAQSLKEIEIIAVDDGSSDMTPFILYELSDFDERLKIIQKENGGVSSARNAGLEIAKGEYVIFQDADDLFGDDTLLNAYNTAKKKNADIVLFQLRTFEGDKMGKFNEYAASLSQSENIDAFDLRLMWNFLVSNKMYERKRLVQSGVRFPNTKYSEEGAFFMQYVFSKPKIAGCASGVALYRRHTSSEGKSVSQSVTKELAQSFCSSMDIILQGAKNAVKDLSKEQQEKYIAEIYYKKAYVLIDQFYRKLWSGNDECVKLCAEEINDAISHINAQQLALLQSINCDLPLSNLPKSKTEAKQHALTNFIIKGGKIEDVEKTIFDLYNQICPFFEVFAVQRIEGFENFENFHLPKTSSMQKLPTIFLKAGAKIDLRSLRLSFRVANKFLKFLPQKARLKFIPLIFKFINFALSNKIIK